MGKAIYCPFPRCKNEVSNYCVLHRAINPAFETAYYQEQRAETLNSWIVSLWPIVEAMEEMWREKARAERQLQDIQRREKIVELFGVTDE